ncbi:MAG: 2-oxoacid:acceptor oxidoreductase family protein [Syntrophales bacterium]|nr:2-oxoacid:acceptor oxidoreductase family protein [Syntrophales bacterium]
MLVKTIFAGFGGQGVLMMGYSFAHAVMNEGYYVTYLPSYGVEMRGGTANCTVCVSDEEIASPVASEPDYLVVMNKPSLYSFQNRVSSKGAIFLNSSIIDVRPSRRDVKIHEIPSSAIAETLGDPRVQNMVILGAFVRRTGIITPEAFLRGLKQIMGERKKAALDINRRAFTAGYELT